MHEKPYDLQFYVDGRGRIPVLEFMRTLSDREAGKCYAYMRLLGEQGNTLGSNYIRHIDGNLWEFRPEFGGQEFQYFYFMMRGHTIMFVHAFKKKTRKTPATEIEIARKRMEEVVAGEQRNW
jgi:phage-related protein